jgi:acetone carboxylase gamma subunit
MSATEDEQTWLAESQNNEIDQKWSPKALCPDLSWLLANEAATAKYGVVHQIDKPHVAFIKFIMTRWCARGLCFFAE